MRLALCPIGKFVFSNEDAMKQKTLLQAKLREWQVDFVDLDGVLEDGLIKDQSHAQVAVDYFRTQVPGVDCLFVPHCNFGTEGAVGVIGRDLGLPTLVWAPRDEAPLPDGTRLRDSLCGTFASTKVLHKLGVPFTYIENCRVDDPPLREGVDRFMRAVATADVLRNGAKIGHIGQRIDFFWTTIVSETELLEKFRLQVQPIDMVDFVNAVRDRIDQGRAGYEKRAKALRETTVVEAFDDDGPLMNILAVADQMQALVDEHGFDALAVQDFTSLVDEMQAYCFYSDSVLADRVPLGIESDIHGAISNLLLQRASGQPATFLADVTVRHPENDNGVLLWHAGAPLSMCHESDRVRLGKHWILPSPLSGMPHFRLKDGPITVARFDGDRNQYKLAVGQGQSTDGPHTLNNYVWMEVDNWPRWERTLMEGPFIHHMGMTYGHYADAIVEAGRYVPDIEIVRLDC